MATEPRSVEATAPALEVRDLCVDYRVRGVWREVLRGISFTVERGGSYGLVGESGCGKSTSALAAIRYLPRNGRVNLIFNLPGYSNPALGSGTMDVFPVASRALFHRADAQHSIERTFWSCASGRPVKTSRTLRFLYGYVEPSRHGWVAEAAVAPGD